MIKEFKNNPVRKSGIVYGKMFETAKKWYQRDPLKGGEYAISFLEAIGKTKIILVSNVIGLLSRCLSLAIFCYFNLGIWSLVLSISINVILVTLYDIFMTFKYLK